jgi:hypothetical protein
MSDDTVRGPNRRRRLHVSVLLLTLVAVVALAAPACSGSGNVAAGLVVEEACHLNSDCASGLICGLGACRAMCRTAADCGTGGSCVDNGDVAVCRYADENNTPCGKPSDCPAPLACASDYRCRNLCNTAADCNVLGITGRVCAKDAEGVYYCAQPSEVSQGRLVAAPPAGAPTTTSVLEPEAGLGVVAVAGAAPTGSIETLIGPSGGTLGIGAAAITIPSGALDGDVPVSITPIAPPVGGVFLGQVFEIAPSGTQFHVPVTVTLSYANTDLEGLPPSAFAVSTLVDGVWQALPGQIQDANARTISGTTTHLSPYAMIEQELDAGRPGATIRDAGGSADAAERRDAAADASLTARDGSSDALAIPIAVDGGGVGVRPIGGDGGEGGVRPIGGEAGVRPIGVDGGEAAGTVAILVPDLGSAFNYYQASYVLGWYFGANAAIQVTSLGFYDASMDGLTESHPVAIYDMATQALLASTTVVPADPLTGFFHYAALGIPLTLTPGHTYVIVALVGTEEYLAFYNIDSTWTVNPAITYEGSAVNYANSSATMLYYPDTFTPTAGDFGPNFEFTGP